MSSWRKSAQILFVGSLLLVIASIATAAPWSGGFSLSSIFGTSSGESPTVFVEKAPYPFSGGVDRHAATSSNGFLYVIGGEAFNGSTYVTTNKLFRYDPVADTWLELAAMPGVTGFTNHEACSMNGKIYVPGGYAGSGPPFNNTNFIYDIGTNTWTTGAVVPAPATLWSVVACDGAANKVYVIGGYDGVGPVTTTKIYQFGLADDMPVPADYNHDNIEDIAVFRPSAGDWYVHLSNGQFGGKHFGQMGDVPVPGDYDGDGEDDVAVYRDGLWYIDQSTAGFYAEGFGLSTDVPIEKKYIP